MRLLSRPHISRSTIVAAIILLSLFLNVPHSASFKVDSTHSQATLTEWTLPTPASGPSALVLDKSGGCWFLEYYGNKLGHLDVNTNTFQEWSIPTAASNPFDLALTSNGQSPTLWGTEYGSDKVFAFSPTSGVFLEYSLPSLNTGVGYISIEPSATQLRVWFTETIRNTNGELIYDPATENATLYEDNFPPAAGGGAYGVFAESNSVWFAGFFALIRWDRASQQYTMWPLPVHGSATGRFLTVDSSGQPWYTQGATNATSDNNFVGVLRADNVLEEWRLPGTGAAPRKIAINPISEQPWIAVRSLAAENGTIAVLSNSSEGTLVTTTPTTAPSGGTPIVLAPTSTKTTGSNQTVLPSVKKIEGLSDNQFIEYAVGSSSPQDVVTDSQGNVWITEPATNKIAELSGFSPDFALSAFPPLVSISKGGSEPISIVGASTSGYQGRPIIIPVTLPLDVTVSPTQSQLNIQPGENATVQVTLDVGPNATAGFNSVTIEGTDGTIAHTTSILLIIGNSTSGPPTPSKCLIAASTFGSELSAQVQLLRQFRNNVLTSQTGASFLIVFNSWYYSFSPSIANYLTDHAATRRVARGALYPLVESLSLSSALFSMLSANPENATVLSGLVASSVIGAVYMGIPLEVIRRKLGLNLRLSIYVCLVLLVSGLGGILLGLNFGYGTLLMVASSETVLSATYGGAALTAESISRLTKNPKVAQWCHRLTSQDRSHDLKQVFLFQLKSMNRSFHEAIENMLGIV